MSERPETDRAGAPAESKPGRVGGESPDISSAVPSEVQPEAQPGWMRVSLIVVGLSVLVLVVVLSRF